MGILATNRLIQYHTFFAGLFHFEISKKDASECIFLCAYNPFLLLWYRRSDFMFSLYGLFLLINWWPLSEGNDLSLSLNIFRLFFMLKMNYSWLLYDFILLYVISELKFQKQGHYQQYPPQETSLSTQYLYYVISTAFPWKL